MDSANADSDHSMTWEDFFGSTSDLTPTLIGIYDSLLEPKPQKPEVSRFDLTAKDARNEPPLQNKPPDLTTNSNQEVTMETITSKDPTKIAGSVKLPLFGNVNKSSLYTMRTKLEIGVDSDKSGANNKTNDSVNSSDISSPMSNLYKSHIKSFKTDKVSDIVTPVNTFDNLSPNVKRIISSASETAKASALKFQKRPTNVVRSSIRGHRSNIPLVGATSKITQSGVEILTSVDIYDQPCGLKTSNKLNEDKITPNEPPTPKIFQIKPELRFDNDSQVTYDVPTNRQAIYDVPLPNNKTALEALSLPYIDQSIELSISTNDREFDPKISSNETSPEIQPNIPQYPKNAIRSTNSLNRKDFAEKEITSKSLKANTYPEAIGSTGNLKLCPVLEGKLNAQQVDVSRPLSMSSIASSSSTSSSGVQNKGGVNSAYLASIESLDDNSDIDANKFVNKGIASNVSEERRSEAIPPFQVTDEVSGLSQLERVCAEIIQTENVYVEDLRQVVEGYLHIWKKEATFSEDELAELFNNIEAIYTFNRSLCEELNICQLDAPSIAKCFVSNTTGFAVYTSYCTGYPRTMERLATLASRPHSARVFRERQIALEHPLPLASYLLKPVQRILKYHLLLQNVVKLCACRETEFALLKMTGIAQHIDDMKRKHEHAVRVQEIQSLLYGWVGLDLTTFGELCAEGTFRVFGAKAMRHVFLFDKMLLITKNREDGILAYKSHIMCNNMMLVEAISGAPLSFHVIPWDAPRSQITLQATSQRHKREWTLLLKRVILENYNAVIPSHARQLVMELGQNKTDDDMLAEKSHNLITQSSMRKQLSAPEYLEKRKLERERRKSFENGIRGRLKKVNRKHTVPVSRIEIARVMCDCPQISAERGVDMTCEKCYTDLCTDCEVELNNKEKERQDKCKCRNDDGNIKSEKCAECDRSLHFIDAGSAEHLERKQSCCKCSDFKSSQESVAKETSLSNTRGYHSSDNIVGYVDTNSKEDISNANNSSCTNVRSIHKTCLKCAKIKENIVVTAPKSTLYARKSRRHDLVKKTDTLRSKSKDDPQRTKLSKIGTWRRKSEPGLQPNVAGIILKKDENLDVNNDLKGTEKIEFECRNCGSNKISRKFRNVDFVVTSDPEAESTRQDATNNAAKQNVEIKMYNSKNIPKKISKLRKSRAKGVRLVPDTTAKFYADLSTDVSNENILHISESNDSLNVIDKIKKHDVTDSKILLPDIISKDDDIDEETYKKLIEKTDSFKKNELEKVKYLNKQKVINEGSEIDTEIQDDEQHTHGANESCEEVEQPLEQIISQLLMQNREFQKLLKKQQLRNTAQRRHQRLLKSHSNPEEAIATINNELSKIKPKYGRQTSENLDQKIIIHDITLLSPPNEIDNSENDHIYETLRVDTAKAAAIVENETVQNNIESLIQGTSNDLVKTAIANSTESDYVYLSVDRFKKNEGNDVDGIYDIPIKRNEKVENPNISPDYYVTMENQNKNEDLENMYDDIVNVCRRQKELSPLNPGEYLPMSPDMQNPNMPEIWLSRQKEHFNVSRDRKSGSLPRSFQVVTNNPEDTNLSTFKCKPNSNSKTYLNRDGKVLSMDRPFTIASDKSDLSYDDVENYMSDGDILKFNKNNNNQKSNHGDIQNISQSTLELEEEIDRCYKNNFEKIKLDSNKNENLLTTSQPNLNVSATSSCEALMIDKTTQRNPKEVNVIHPEHKIYKPTSNMLSLKNVLNRFKNKNPSKSNSIDNAEINANDPSSPDSAKSDLKSPTSGEKRSALNPRSYSKNLLQRFRSIIGDEHSVENIKSDVSHKKNDNEGTIVKNEIKVVITSTDTSPLTSTIVYTINDNLTRSVCENTTLTESQSEKQHLEPLSYSCNNISDPKTDQLSKPNYEKSISVISNTSVASTSSPSKSNNSSYQSLNKLPIYMQGSKNLGARIAQSDYVDPTTLVSGIKNINILINKNAVRPDSLFSNSSFVTSSSEGTYQSENTTKNSSNSNPAAECNGAEKTKSSDSSVQMNSDESYYEKSFEKIEHITDEDMFRDSAVYSDQDESDDIKTTSSVKDNIVTKQHTKSESVKRNSSFKSESVTLSNTKLENRSSMQTTYTMSTSKVQQQLYVAKKEQKPLTSRSKVAPPVPAKPKLTNIPISSDKQASQLKTFSTNTNTNLSRITHQNSFESQNIKTIKRNTSIKQSFLRSESTPSDNSGTKISRQFTPGNNLGLKSPSQEVVTKNEETEVTDNLKVHNNIQMKRLSFERASLDSSTRKMRATLTEQKRSSSEIPKLTSKTVLERRMEIESLSKSTKKPSQMTKPKLITTKMSTFGERSSTESSRNENKTSNNETANIPKTQSSINEDVAESESKESWVKQVVNKFQ